MKIVENLAAVALRQLYDGQRPPEQLRTLFASHGDRLRQILAHAAGLGWRGLELAVAGKAAWDKCQPRLTPADEPLIPKVQAFLATPVFGDYSTLTPEFRCQAWRQLRAARFEGHPGPLGADTTWLDGALTPDAAAGHAAQWRQVEQIAAELGLAFPALPELLLHRAGDGPPAIARAVALSCRPFLESEPELAPLVAGLTPLYQADRAAVEGLIEAVTDFGDRLDVLYGGLLGDDEARPLFDVEAETRELPEPVRHLGRLVACALRRHHLHAIPSFLDGVAISAETDRQRVKDLATRIHALPADQQRKLPGLLHGIGVLEVAAGQLDAAEKDLQAAAAGVTAAPLQAALCQAVSRVALEAHHWPVALEAMSRAATLDPRLAVYPAEKFEAERVLRCEPVGAALLCKHRSSGNRVVVRPLWSEGLAGSVGEAIREMRSLDELDHSALLRLRDVDYADPAKQRPYIVTDHFDGMTLAEYVRQNGPLPAPEMLKVARIIADVLHAAHERKVLHRDLKPASVLIRKDGANWRIKVINFCLAPRPSLLFAALAGPPGWSRTVLGSTMLTSLPYIAPEQLGVVEGTAPGPHSDVYSFGRLCYFGLLGTPEPDDEEKEDLPNSWRKLLGQCVARNLDRRLTGFQAIRKRIGAPSATSAEPEPAPAAPAPAPAAASAPAKPATDRNVIENYVNRGMAFKQQGNTDRALAAFTKALQLDPNHLPAYFKRGNTYLDRSDYDRAIADYTQALRLDPNNPSAYMNRGLAHAKKGNYDAVINDCSEAVRLDPKLAQAYSIRAAAYWERGERHRAIADYSLALRCDPKNALAYNGRGLAFAEEGDYDRAIADYTQALRCEPRLGVAYLNRGTAYRAKTLLDQALGDYNKALRLEPRNVMGYYCRGLAQFGKHSYDEALTDLNKALTLDPRHAEAAQCREEVLKARSRSAAGGTPAPAPAAGKVPAPSGSGTMAPPKVKSSRRRTMVVPTAPKIVPKTPAEQADEERKQMRAAAYFASGKTAYEQEKYKEAIEHFNRALQVDAKDSQLHFHRGLAHVAQDDFAEALRDFTESIKLNPKNAQAHYQCGLTHRLLGQHDLAIEDYSRAIKLDPRLALAYRNRSLAYAARGETDKARADYERALRLDPSLAKEE